MVTTVHVCHFRLVFGTQYHTRVVPCEYPTITTTKNEQPQPQLHNFNFHNDNDNDDDNDTTTDDEDDNDNDDERRTLVGTAKRNVTSQSHSFPPSHSGVDPTVAAQTPYNIIPILNVPSVQCTVQKVLQSSELMNVEVSGRGSECGSE